MLTTSHKQPIRNHIFHGLTRSLCPECRRVVDAQMLIRDGAVFLRKHCLEHGQQEALVSSDADWYLKSLKYNKPGSTPLEFTTTVEKGCPSDCGLCDQHLQHTCVGIIEVTTRCNLECPTCFADAGVGSDLSLKQVEAILDRLFQTEKQPEIVQISGGEPTLHPEFVGLVETKAPFNVLEVLFRAQGGAG